MFSAFRLIVLLGILAVCGSTAWAQRASNWRVFKATDGLAESSASSVSISQRTNVWAWHSDANAASRLTGYKIKSFPTAHSGNSKIYESRVGQIWAPYPEGLQEFKNDAWITYPIKEIQREYQTNIVRNARPISLVPLKQGHVLALLSDRLLKFNNEWPPQAEATTVRSVQQTRLEKFTDMILARDGTIWIAGERGLMRSTNVFRAGSVDAKWEEFLLPDEIHMHDLQQPLTDDEGGVTVVGEQKENQRRAAVCFDGKEWHPLPFTRENLRHAWRGVDGAFWAVSINSLFYLGAGEKEFVENTDITASRYLDVATEVGGVFWLATSEGLFRHAPSLWRVPPGLRPWNSPVQSISEDADGRIWFVDADSLNVLDGTTWKEFPFPEIVEPGFPLTQKSFPLRNGRIVIDANGHLLQFNPKTSDFKFVSNQTGQRVKPLGFLKDDVLVVQVLGAKPNTTSHFATLEGDNFQPFPETLPALPDEAELLFLHAAANGDLWLSTSAGLLFFHNKSWRAISGADAPDAALCILEAGGKTWFGGRDRIWEFDGQNWSTVRSGFERVNSMRQTRDGSIWVATSSGLLRFFKGTWIINSTEEGLPSAMTMAVFEDRRGRLWAGTSRGPSLFHPEVDADPPTAFVVRGNRSSDGSFEVAFSGRDKWKYTPADDLVFSYRMDEQEWSPFQSERMVTFPELTGGTHYFQVRAMDRNGNVDSNPDLREFKIPIPWYHETRLLLIGFVGLAGVLFFAGLAINRHRRLVRSYAEVEKTVALRTKQLEEANAQLLHNQKMTALGSLAAGVAHDFNSILSIIKGSAQIIESNPEDHEKVKARASRINTAIEQGSGIVKAMLGFSRPNEKQSAPCHLNQVVEETIKLLGDRFLREVEVKFEPGKPLPETVMAKDLVQQILLNFIFNAADALNGHGQILLRTGQFNEVPVQAVLPPEKTAAYLFVSVIDAGCGIDPEIRPRIFEPFFTTKAFSSRRGTGLGLSMVYQMAKETGCGLMVESEVGKGSVFTLVIPVRKIVQ